MNIPREGNSRSKARRRNRRTEGSPEWLEVGLWEEAGWGWARASLMCPDEELDSMWGLPGRSLPSLTSPKGPSSPVRGSSHRPSLWPLLGPLPLPLDTKGPVQQPLGLAFPGETPWLSPHSHISGVPDTAHAQLKRPRDRSAWNTGTQGTTCG